MIPRYGKTISFINRSTSFNQIVDIVSDYPAISTGRGGILYTGRVGGIGTTYFANSVYNQLVKSGYKPGFIEQTSRGKLLGFKDVELAISAKMSHIGEMKNISGDDLRHFIGNSLYGSHKIPAGEIGSLATSLWGRASAEFSDSLTGNVIAVGSVAEADFTRVYGSLELQNMLQKMSANTLGGISLPTLKEAGSVAFRLTLTKFTKLHNDVLMFASKLPSRSRSEI